MFSETASQTDACASLLAEVDFKWLMAGLGLRIDLPRFRSDAAYAKKLLSLALDSESFALRERATLLQSQQSKTQPSAHHLADITKPHSDEQA